MNHRWSRSDRWALKRLIDRRQLGGVGGNLDLRGVDRLILGIEDVDLLGLWIFVGLFGRRREAHAIDVGEASFLASFSFQTVAIAMSVRFTATAIMK